MLIPHSTLPAITLARRMVRRYNTPMPSTSKESVSILYRIPVGAALVQTLTSVQRRLLRAILTMPSANQPLPLDSTARPGKPNSEQAPDIPNKLGIPTPLEKPEKPLPAGRWTRAWVEQAIRAARDRGEAVNLGKLDLRGLDLSGLHLVNASLGWSKLEQANLTRARLSRANLIGADLQRAILVGADLSFADVRQALLQNAVLRQANLSRADLSKANLCGADLSEADLTYAILDDIVYSAATIWPAGFDASATNAARIPAAATEAQPASQIKAALPETNIKRAPRPYALFIAIGALFIGLIAFGMILDVMHEPDRLGQWVILFSMIILAFRWAWLKMHA